MSDAPTSVGDCSISEYLWRQVVVDRFNDRAPGFVERSGYDVIDMPLYFGTPSNDGKLIHLGKHGIGAVGLTVYADTVPLEVKHTLGAL